MALDNIGLHVGLPVKVADAIVATGTARIRPFSITAPPGPHKVTLNQVGATVITVNVEQSQDGGANWRLIQATAFDLIATPTVSFEVWPGVLYRTNVATLTTTPADIYATLY